MLVWALLYFVEPAEGDGPNIASARTLVFIVPGTYGNDGFWPNVVPDKATFGSELQRGLGEGGEVYPYLWWGTNENASRSKAAAALAELIDKKGEAFERVCIVGHSHGGNIALMAAGLCHRKIDEIVCLDTPHFYLDMKSTAGKFLPVPIYCTWESRKNVGKIVSICARNDEVLAWTALFPGLNTAVAIPLTQGWQEHLDFPRLLNDGIGHFVKEVFCYPLLNVADVNISVLSEVQNTLARHERMHSRRVGFLIGQAIRPAADVQTIHYLDTLIIPPNADDGGPIDAGDQQRWLEGHAGEFGRVAWRMANLTIHMDSVAEVSEGKKSASMLRCYGKAEGKSASVLIYEGASTDYMWAPKLMVKDHTELRLDLLRRDGARLVNLGSCSFGIDRDPPVELSAPHSGSSGWSAKLEWEAMHY